ncbi:flagellar motor switch protein FliM [Nocardioidaceae bacterium]|nr:flagellar motor switch protein FliM [Nocardioidaceae bacterium]
MTASTTAADPRGHVLGSRARRRRELPPVDYDFRQPIQLSREHSRLLQIGFDTFARQATTVFTSSLRTVCTCSLLNIEQTSYADYIDDLMAPTYMTVMTLEPLAGLGIFEIPLAAVMASVDHMLGGPGSGDQPVRPLTDIESSVASGLVQRLLGELRYSLAGTLGIEPAVHEVEYSPQFAQAAAAGDAMVRARLDVHVGDVGAVMTVCLPFSSVLPALAKAAAPAPASERERAQRANAAELVGATFEEVPVTATVQLSGTPTDPAVLSGLEPGTVLRLAHHADRPLDLVVEDVVLASVRPGAHGRRLAALVVPDPEETP